MESLKKELIEKIENLQDQEEMQHPEFYSGYSFAINDVVELIKKFNFIDSSLQLNERLKTSFEDYKNKHFIEMENYYLNRYNAEHLNLEQIMDKYLDD